MHHERVIERRCAKKKLIQFLAAISETFLNSSISNRKAKLIFFGVEIHLLFEFTSLKKLKKNLRRQTEQIKEGLCALS